MTPLQVAESEVGRLQKCEDDYRRIAANRLTEIEALRAKVAELEAAYEVESERLYHLDTCTPAERRVLEAVKGADMQEFEPDTEDPSTGDGHLYTDDQIRIVEAAWAAWPERGHNTCAGVCMACGDNQKEE
jgi:hypothetical protein